MILTKEIYSEVYEILNTSNREYIDKIPKKLLAFVDEKRDKDYNSDNSIPIWKRNYKEETLAIIALFNLKYWCEDDEEKNRLKQIYKENEDRYQQELREKYNAQNVFNNKTKKDNITAQNLELVPIKEKGFLIKILEKLKSFFNLN